MRTLERSVAAGIDLDHLLMPDPAGRAVRCRPDRIGTLEREVPALRGGPVEKVRCECDDACAEPVLGERPSGPTRNGACYE